MLPTFFVIGAAKTGTTALYYYLDQHPDIHMSPVKEPDFFADPNGPFPFGRVSSRARYERLFESELSVRGEASHTYSVFPLHRGVPDRIQQLVPNAKFIYLVRDPIERMRALYIQTSSWRRTGSFEATLGDIHDPSNEYICGSRYMLQVNQYLSIFGPERLLVIDQQDLRSQRRSTLQKIFAFLGASDNYWTDEFDEAHNKSNERIRIPRTLRRLAQSGGVRAVLNRLPEGNRERLIDMGKRAIGRPIPVSELPQSVEAECRALFVEDVTALREFTKQRFDSWSV